ncbi:AAA family ATPase [Proteiniclasticum sediminis]|uniref:AAA family ATPase n=1 Tax=Proteiniclasticum sediminis TaxID=2804028 RepID=UPI001E4F4457|nr:ATP-binding protein [Proteiniclasticum sediminis]
MNAGRQTSLSQNLIRDYNLRILPSAVLYGANASGKSNIIMSLAVMKDIVLSGSLEADLPSLKNLELYPFAYLEADMPMKFTIDFLSKEQRMEYEFEIMVSSFKKENRRIVSESLTLIDRSSQKTNIYQREGNRVQINHAKKALAIIGFDLKLLRSFERKINENVDDSELFLARAFKSTISSELADIVLDFFKDELVVVSDFTLKKANLIFSMQDKPQKDFLAWNDVLEGFVKRADFGPQDIAFRPNKTESNDTSMELISVYHYKDKHVMIPAELMESRGTLKLLDFALPFNGLFKAGGVFILDEFDAAIHPEMIKGILALFNDRELNQAGAQLIFTTHNPIYLNNQIFRRDQIRFVEKDTDTYESILYSLADFGSEEVRNDHNYLINYFKGNYGALPFIDFSTLLVDEENKEDEDGLL